MSRSGHVSSANAESRRAVRPRSQFFTPTTPCTAFRRMSGSKWKCVRSKKLRREARRMRESSPGAIGAMCRQNAASVHAPPLRNLRHPLSFAQDSTPALCKRYSTHWASRTTCNWLKTNDRVTLYPSQNRWGLCASEPHTFRVRSSSAGSTSVGFRSRKELECTRQLESQTRKSEGGFSWQLILL